MSGFWLDRNVRFPSGSGLVSFHVYGLGRRSRPPFRQWLLRELTERFVVVGE